ncbi:MAG: hypothetical protein AB8B87_13160 [Granulosicoccus sp.]
MRHVIQLLLGIVAIALGSLVQLAQADETPDPKGLVIVMNKDIDMRSIDDEELRRLFTGKSRRLPNGARAALASYAPESSFFNKRILGLSDARVAALWSRLRFSGRTPPPRIFNNTKALVDYVASTPNAIAYMPASVARVGVRVISNVPR